MKQSISIILGIFSIVLLVTYAEAAESGGSLGPANKPDANLLKVVKKLTPDILKELCKKLGQAGKPRCKTGKLEPLLFKSQTVAGANYFVKLRDDEKLIWHVKIFEQTWTNTLQLSDTQGPKTEADEIVFF